MDIDRFFAVEFAEHAAVTAATRAALAEPFARLVTLVTGAVRSGGKIMLFGNGGSAADATTSRPSSRSATSATAPPSPPSA